MEPGERTGGRKDGNSNRTGKIGDRMGVFPFNYVEVTSEASAGSPAVQEVFKLAN